MCFECIRENRSLFLHMLYDSLRIVSIDRVFLFMGMNLRERSD